MTGPLAQQFAQLGGTLDFLREIENGTRCGTCQRPHATDDDWQRYDEGEGEHLCWETVCSHEPESPTALERLVESRGGLSAIERHVQEMEMALERIVETAEPREWETPGHPMNEWTKREPVLRIARAALPAREKEEE